MQRGHNRKEWHYQLEYFEDEKRQSPLKLSHFPLFKFKITLKGFMKIRCQRTCVFFEIRTRDAQDKRSFSWSAVLFLWFVDLRISWWRINLAQINFFSVMFEWMPLLPSPFPETETFDPSARWLCTKIKHFLYFYFTPSLSLISVLDCGPFILFKTFLLYPPRCLEKEERMVCCEIGWRKSLSALFSSGE